MKKIRIIDYIVSIIFSITFIILLGCVAVLPIAKSKSYYLSEHKKNNVKQILQETSFRGGTCYCYDKDGNYMSYYVPYHEVTDEDIVNATNHIIDYLYSEKVESMQFQVDTDEGKVDFFSEQAIVHMADVKVLFIGGIKLCYICIVIFVLCLVYLILTRKHSFNILLNVYLRTLIVFGVATILIGLFAMIDFDTAFEVFHKIIFPDSSKVKLALSFSYTDTLTNVLTAEFFMHIGFANWSNLHYFNWFKYLFRFISQKASNKKHIKRSNDRFIFLIQYCRTHQVLQMLRFLEVHLQF